MFSTLLSVVICHPGLGWISVGCKGQADFRLWTYSGVAVTTHDALVPDYAREFERPGFSSLLPKTQQQPGRGLVQGGGTRGTGGGRGR